MMFGQSVLARALKKAGIPFDKNKAHSACYDAYVTAQLFCLITNRIDDFEQRQLIPNPVKSTEDNPS